MDNRIRYVDCLRTISILFLIAINIAMVFKYKSVGSLQEYVIFTTFGFGVPIFLMLLGLLMLDRDYSDIKTFIKTDFLRIFIPFLIWNTLLALLMTYLQVNLVWYFSYLNLWLNIGMLGCYLVFTYHYQWYFSICWANKIKRCKIFPYPCNFCIIYLPTNRIYWVSNLF